MTSEARMKANKANAARSTGPRTAAGRERSRENALKHGLCAEVVGLEDPREVDERARELAESGGSSPSGGFRLDSWVCQQAATIGLRIEQAQAMQEAAIERSVLRAEMNWEEDRRLEAALLGGKLSGRVRPDQVVEKLRQTLQGCEWLMTRWAMLARAADLGGCWTPEQVTLAFDLLGTPREFREGDSPGSEIDLQGRLAGPDVELAELARRQVADLDQRLEVLAELDAADRRAAVAGLADDAELRRLRRYETALERRFRWMIELIREPSAPSKSEIPQPGPQPGSDAEAESSTSPVVEPTGPEAVSIGKPAQGPPREPSRAERRLMKAESRRESKRRKLEELRA